MYIIYDIIHYLSYYIFGTCIFIINHLQTVSQVSSLLDLTQSIVRAYKGKDVVCACGFMYAPICVLLRFLVVIIWMNS